MSTILAVDDDFDIRLFLSRILTHMGHKVIVAHDGRVGICQFNAGNHFDLVITDIEMPVADGYELAKHIRKSKRPDTPVLAITGSMDLKMRYELFDFILMKPFKKESLLNAIKFII